MRFRFTFLLIFSLLTAKSLCAQNTLDSIPVNYDTVMSKVTAGNVAYKTMAIRAKLVWDDGKTEQSFHASIRILKDSLIWVSLTGVMGVEGVRVLITPDSFRIINKQSNEYASRDLTFLRNWLMFPVNFKMLQQLIAGEKADIQERATLASYRDSMYLLYSETDKMLEKAWVNPENYTLDKMVLKDKLLTQDMTVTFDTYKSVGEKGSKFFSHQRNIVIHRSGAALTLSIEITKLKVNEDLSYPFDMKGAKREE